MPFNLDFSSSRDTLARLQQFMQYDMMGRRASERAQKQAILESALASELSGQKLQQDLYLESVRSANQKSEETNKAILQVLQMPEFDGAVSVLNMARAGKLGPEQEPLVTRAKELMENAYTTLGNAFYAVQTGKAGPDHLANIVKFFGQKGMEYSKDLGISLRAIEKNEIDRRANEINEAKVKREMLNYPDALKNDIEMIKDAMKFVETQGQDAPQSWGSNMMSLFSGAGLRAYATLPGPIQGRVLQGLAEILRNITRAGQERQMNPNELKFVAESRNADLLRKPVSAAGGGVLDPVTGERESDEAVYQKDAVRAKVSVLKKRFMDAMNRRLTVQEYEQYKILAEKVKAKAPMTPEEKVAYNNFERRLWWIPTEEDETFFTGLATEYYNRRFLSEGEEPLPLPPGYTPQDAGEDGLIKE